MIAGDTGFERKETKDEGRESVAENNKKRACETERECVLGKGNQLRPEGERGQGPGMLHHLKSRKRKEQPKRLGKRKDDIQESEMTRKSK